MNILHIVNHCGGGVGRVLFAYIREELKSNKNNHSIFCLEPTKNAVEDFDDIEYLISYDIQLLNDLIISSDIVVVHYYNHPLVIDFLLNYDIPDCRLIAYSHNSNLHLPYIHSKKLLDVFDKFVFTTNASYEAKEIIELSEDYSDKLITIESAFGSEYVESSTEKLHGGFNVGYIGTADYSKLNSEFAEMCSLVKSPAKFIVCSGDNNQRHIKEDALYWNVFDDIYFMGRVDSVYPYLKKCDVFGYPLNRLHNFSAEQAIGEAMIFGAVPVVLNNPAERNIIKNGLTGIIASDKYEYAKAIDYLYNNPDKRKQMAEAGREFALERYSIKRNVNLWNEVFEEVIKIPKYKHTWNNIEKTYDGYELFIESLGDYSYYFEGYDVNRIKTLLNLYPQLKAKNKGSINQYIKYFPNDSMLKKCKELMNEN